MIAGEKGRTGELLKFGCRANVLGSGTGFGEFNYAEPFRTPSLKPGFRELPAVLLTVCRADWALYHAFARRRFKCVVDILAIVLYCRKKYRFYVTYSAYTCERSTERA